jgi:hypothetical protein
MTSYWFSPDPSEFTSSRISLDFGLRKADLYFRELVVPQLGRVWFVRQFSWPLAALVLHQDLQAQRTRVPKPAAICHAIEALACKLEHYINPDGSDRILGTRAFTHDSEKQIWRFEQLSKPSFYVRNTHRQAASRALKSDGESDGGLGFASGPRFDLLVLESVGRELANTFLQQRVGTGGMTLHKWLQGWIEDTRDVSAVKTSLHKKLSPEQPSDEERDFVRRRVLDTSTPACTTRQRLASAIGTVKKLPDIEKVIIPRLRREGHEAQAAEIVAARAFGAMLDRARDVIGELTRAIEPKPISVAALAKEKSIARALLSLKQSAHSFVEKAEKASIDSSKEPTSHAFAFAKTILNAADSEQAIRFMVSKSGTVIRLSDEFVAPGDLFRVIDAGESTGDQEEGATSIEPDIAQQHQTGRTFRIANLHSLLRDIGSRKKL